MTVETSHFERFLHTCGQIPLIVLDWFRRLVAQIQNTHNRVLGEKKDWIIIYYITNTPKSTHRRTKTRLFHLAIVESHYYRMCSNSFCLEKEQKLEASYKHDQKHDLLDFEKYGRNFDKKQGISCDKYFRVG